MKTINNAVLRSVFAVVLGLVLILWPEATINYLVVIIGVLFVIPGLISVIAYFTRNREIQPSPMFPIEGAGSILFGLWLIIMPTFFVSILMYVLGVLLIIAGVQQIMTLISARKWTTVGFGFYIIPVLIFIAGIIILSNPFQVAANTFMFLGIAAIIYGFSELFNWFRFKKNTSSQTEV